MALSLSLEIALALLAGLMAGNCMLPTKFNAQTHPPGHRSVATYSAQAFSPLRAAPTPAMFAENPRACPQTPHLWVAGVKQISLLSVDKDTYPRKP
jgi:hypothetical protein